MAKSCTIFIFVLAFYCYHVDGQAILVAPVNTAAKIGDPSILHCTVERADRDITWNFQANGTTLSEQVYFWDGSEEGISPGYSVNPASRDQGIMDITITETSSAFAGIYQCGISGVVPIKRQARFVSLEQVTCDPPPGEREIIEGATVILSGDVVFVGYKPPSLQWTSSQSTVPLAGEWTWNYERSTFAANVTAEPALDMMDFTCDLAFVSDIGDTEPVPVYNDTCTTHFLVLHGATQIEILPDPGDIVSVDVGDYINCTASGRPLPIITWMDENFDVFEVSSLVILAEWSEQRKTFTCTARNDVNGQPHEASLNIEVMVVTPTSAPSTDTASMAPWVIAVAIIVPVLVIGGATGGAIYYVKHKKKKDKKKDATMAKVAAGHGGPVGPGVTGHPPPGPPPGQRLQYQSAATMVPLVDSGQNVHKGRDSPGYGDLGVKQFSADNTLLGNSADSIDMDPDPKYGARYGSRGNMGGSQSTLGQPPPSFPPPQLTADIVRSSIGSNGEYPGYPNGGLPLGNHPHMMHQQMPPMQPGDSHMGSQHSLHNIQAARGMMGSRGSLASQGSRNYVNASYQLPVGEIADTTV